MKEKCANGSSPIVKGHFCSFGINVMVEEMLTHYGVVGVRVSYRVRSRYQCAGRQVRGSAILYL